VKDARVRSPRRGKRGVGWWLFRVSCLLSPVSCLLVLGAACRPASTLPVVGPAPEFSLVDQQGRPFSSSDLAGKVVVANFVFTTCTDICPLLTGTMAQVQERLKQAGLFERKAMLISISVDPEQDTPEALAAYAERFRADPAGWRFLTGDRAQIDSLLVTGYKVGAPPRTPRRDGSPPEIVHSSRFVVTDPNGQIRWYARGEEIDIDQLVEEVRRLVA
jgi:protein SCO1